MCAIYVCTPNEIGYVAENVWYGVASVTRIDKIISLVCKRALLTRRYSAKETYNLIDPTDRSHPILLFIGINNKILQTTHLQLETLN